VFGLAQHGMARIFARDGEWNAVGIVIFPQNGGQAGVARHQGEAADGRSHGLGHISLRGFAHRGSPNLLSQANSESGGEVKIRRTSNGQSDRRRRRKLVLRDVFSQKALV